jgi:hypothetical protein
MSKSVLVEAGSSAGLTLDRHLFARLRDVTIDTTPWHRHLWEIGSVLALREVQEAAQWLETQVLSPAAMRWMCRDLERQAAGDQGIGGPEMRRQLRDTLRADLSAHSRHRRRLAQLIDMIDEGYVSRWTAAVHGSQGQRRNAWRARSPRTCSTAGTACATFIRNFGTWHPVTRRLQT